MKLLDYLAPALCVLVGLGVRHYRKYSKLPPGPPANLFGNAHLIPRTESWKTFKAFATSFGPILCFWVFNTKTIVLNDYKTADDLLNRRSAVYSTRPTFWMLVQLPKRENVVFFTKSTNPRFKTYRRLLSKTLNREAILGYRDVQVDECQTLMKGLLRSPDDFVLHIRRNATAVMMNVAYGYQIESEKDKFVSLVDEQIALSNSLCIPGKYLVEYIPLLRFVPSWFPGAGFKNIARAAGIQFVKNERTLFDWAKSQIVTGSYKQSFISDHLNGDFDINEEDKESTLSLTGFALYSGGGDTVVSLLTTFFLLMALYPEVQHRAHEEVDHVLSGNMAAENDRPSMPYVNAIIKEVLRWGTVAPFGIPHAVTEDDYYNGYYIPRGTRILANIWAMAHDENIYPDPDKFDPERFLGDNQQLDPMNFSFGFGRRICPGIQLVEASVFLNITTILANFIISKKIDKDGKEIEPEIHWSSGQVSHLRPFPCQITPRAVGSVLIE